MNISENHHPPASTAEDQAEAGKFFRYMADYVGFSPADAAVIRETRWIIAKHLPPIVSDFYTHLLRYPLTRNLFLRADGSVNEDYLVLRMRHLSNFWLRSAEGVYDDKFASYVDFAGRAHTSRGADPNIYVAERYVIGQVGMIQHAISYAISIELREQDDELEFHAVEAWDKLMMVLLEMLARAYGHERQPEDYGTSVPVDAQWVRTLADQAIDKEHGNAQAQRTRRVAVATVGEIEDGQRKIVQVDGLSIGVFHHNGAWYAIRNSCVHQGGPVATGTLQGDVLICPWHGYKFDLPSGNCITDPDAELDRYPVTVAEGSVHLDMPVTAQIAAVQLHAVPMQPVQVQIALPQEDTQTLQDNEFYTAQLAVGQMKMLTVGRLTILVYNVSGTYYATDEACTHEDGPLSASTLEGSTITCLLHGSCFDVTNGAVTCPPATVPLKTYPVIVEGEIGRVLVGQP